jgi:signal transduction histidine kinase/CheY-like chemotaxis protein
MLTELDCPGCTWEVDGLDIGEPLPETLRAIVLTTPLDQRTQLYPYIYLGDSLVVDVHVLTHGSNRQMILQDVSDSHDAELRLQQKAHEVSLLLEKQAELNRDLVSSRAEAERASQAKSRFIASMSHEFRTPINSIMGHAELLAGQAVDPDLTAAIQRASWHLLTLVENLLEQARQGEGIVQINPSKVAMNEVLRDMRELFALQAASRGLELQVTGPKDPAFLETDELRLRQILINLLSNAIRYTEAGRVTLSCEVVEDRLAVSVSDTGRGINKEDQNRIFLPFARLDPHRETGAGLGLTITRQLVEAMGGQLELDSEPDRGSTFSFSLPGVALSERSAGAVLSGLSVLVVDDDADICAMYEIVLTDWGMQVETAAGYQQAIEAVKSDHFDLLITDLFLEDGNGMDLIGELRNAGKATRCILCSGSSAQSFPDAAVSYGADAFLLKPVQPEHLKSVLGETMNRQT